jgi:hypothetical protein
VDYIIRSFTQAIGLPKPKVYVFALAIILHHVRVSLPEIQELTLETLFKKILCSNDKCCL